jgi:retinol-binding protein 3
MKTIQIVYAFALAGLCLGPAQVSGPRFTPALRTQTVEAIIEVMQERYVSPDLAAKAEKLLRSEMEKGAYSNVTTGPEFARLLGEQLRTLLGDAHVRVSYSEQPLPPRAQRERPSEAEIEAQKRFAKAMNGGVERAERLIGNVGYLNLRAFIDPEFSERPIRAAMELLSETDALIIDLRGNGGGRPDTVQLLSSYFFDTKVHLNTLVWRDGSRQEFWTLEQVGGSRYLDRDLYLLIGSGTASAAEEFGYNLRNLERATLVGAKTWGGANPGAQVRLNDHFSMFVPNGRAENPVTKTNWEGVGVLPHVEVPEADSLDKAHRMALARLLEKATDPAERQRLERAIAQLGGG